VAGRAPSRARELTIGEAVARLAPQFPGLTVAAVRRVEAEGRFVAGRTPTGYRRYSESDLEQLRVVLSLGPGASVPAVPRPAEAPEAPRTAAAAAGEAPAHRRHPAPRRAVQVPQQAAQVPQQTAQGVAAGSLIGVAAASAASSEPMRANAVGGQLPAGGAGTGTVPSGREGTARAATGGAAPSPAGAGTPGGPGGSGGAGGSERAGGSEKALPATTGGPAPSTPAAAPARRAARRWPEPEFFAPDLGEVGFDRDQLAATVRGERAWIDELVDFGLLPDRERFGGEQLLVARACAELAESGLEPRHLRTVVASAVRTAELVASATAGCGAGRAARTAEAAAAAVRLHAALVRAALVQAVGSR
jgi:DNA-binding transcriptional MerR regulator